MNVFVWIVTVVFVILAIIIGTQNGATFVDVYLLKWHFKDLPLSIVLIEAIVLGMFFVIVIGGVNEFRLRNRLRLRAKEIRELKQELDALRSLPVSEMEEVGEEGEQGKEGG